MSVAMHVTKVMLKYGLYPVNLRMPLIEGCLNNNTMTKQLIDYLIKVNLIPDIRTFNHIIKALCEMRLVGDATILVDILLKYDTKPM